MKMKPIYLILSIMLLFTNLWSQEISLEYGKITADELNMTVYEPDTSAVAVVIYENGNLYYDFWLNMMFELKRKVKILKQEGVQEADVGIPHISFKHNLEFITDLEAIAYNIENGEVVKTKLEKQYIFEEAISKDYHLMKFSIPGVKVGTIIEYKYTVKNTFSTNIPDWIIQKDIPVMNSYFEALIPEFFIYNIDATKGFETIHVEKNHKYETFTNSIQSKSLHYKFTAQNIPAIKKEPYVWNLNDYTTGVTFELTAQKSFGGYFQPFTNTWAELEKSLRDFTDFGTNIKMSNPYKKETKIIVSTITDEEERIEKLYEMVKNKIKWNEKYSLMGSKTRDAVKKGIGDNGQINMVLHSVLKSAGIRVYPILINPRSYGRIPFAHPSIEKINTFVVCAVTSDGKKFYMDGSAIYGGLNMLPINLLVDRGYIFDEKNFKKWVDLTNIAKNQKTVNQKIEIDETGSIICERSSRHINQFAYQFKSAFQSPEDSLKYIEKIQNENDVTVTDFKVSGNNNMSKIVEERMKIVSNQQFDSEYKYINPLIFKTIENPFIQSERKLPIEFDFPYSLTVRTLIIVPDGYIIEEIPSAEHYEIDENKCSYRYYIVQNENSILLNFNFDLNQLIFLQHDYDLIRDFFGQAATKCSELIVLKKL